MAAAAIPPYCKNMEIGSLNKGAMLQSFFYCSRDMNLYTLSRLSWMNANKLAYTALSLCYNPSDVGVVISCEHKDRSLYVNNYAYSCHYGIAYCKASNDCSCWFGQSGLKMPLPDLFGFSFFVNFQNLIKIM